MSFHRFFVPALSVSAALISHATAGTLHLSGSTTVSGAIVPRLAQIQSASHQTVQLSAQSSTYGLLSLAHGACDVAMVSGSFEDTAAKANEKQPGVIDPTQYASARVGEERLVFIVNPHNAVRELSKAQIAAIYTGRVRNWRDVGGADAPITVVTLHDSTSIVQDRILDGTPIMTQAKAVTSAAQIPAIVASDPNAIGIISTAHARGSTTVLKTDAEIAVPLFLVTKGTPTPDESALIAACRTQLAAK
jgi:phosphate transport system substrate-binding protein